MLLLKAAELGGGLRFLTVFSQIFPQMAPLLRLKQACISRHLLVKPQNDEAATNDSEAQHEDKVNI